MANIKTRALSDEEYETLISLIAQGYIDNQGVTRRENRTVALVLVLMANLGLRVGDTIKLRLSDFVQEGEHYRLNITEEKTSKKRHFKTSKNVYLYILNFAHEQGIGKDERLFKLTVRAVQKCLSNAVNYMGMIDVGTHSFRKYFAVSHYLLSNHDIRLIQHLLQHSSISISERYLSVNESKVNKALENHIRLPNI